MDCLRDELFDRCTEGICGSSSCCDRDVKPDFCDCNDWTDMLSSIIVVVSNVLDVTGHFVSNLGRTPRCDLGTILAGSPSFSLSTIAFCRARPLITSHSLYPLLFGFLMVLLLLLSGCRLKTKSWNDILS